MLGDCGCGYLGSVTAISQINNINGTAGRVAPYSLWNCCTIGVCTQPANFSQQIKGGSRGQLENDNSDSLNTRILPQKRDFASSVLVRTITPDSLTCGVEAWAVNDRGDLEESCSLRSQKKKKLGYCIALEKATKGRTPQTGLFFKYFYWWPLLSGGRTPPSLYYYYSSYHKPRHRDLASSASIALGTRDTIWRLTQLGRNLQC